MNDSTESRDLEGSVPFTVCRKSLVEREAWAKPLLVRLDMGETELGSAVHFDGGGFS